MRCSPPSGFTLIEVLVALVLVAIGLLETVATSALVVRESDEGRTLAAAVTVAANRLELLRAHGCTIESGQANGPRGLAEQWSSAVFVPGIRDVRDSLSYWIAGTPRTMVLVSRFPC